MSACKIMWIIQPVLSIIVLHMLEVTSTANCTASTSNKNGSTQTSCKDICTVLNPLVYGLICFLAAIVVILLILLFKVSLRHGTRVDTHEKREPTPVCQNDEPINIHPPSVNDADDSSSTSSESPEGSLSDISSGCQRYVSAPDRRKDSDYINISEGASSGQVDFKKNPKPRQDIDYVNVNEPRKTTKKVKGKGDDGTASVSSDTSVESAVNYSMVVFTKLNK